MSVAIGFNVLAFSFIDAVLLQALPYVDADGLYLIWNHGPQTGVPRIPLSGKNISLYSAEQDWLESFTAFRLRLRARQRAMILGGESPEWVDAVAATAELTRTLGVEPMLGRGFQDEDDEPGAPKVVILSHGFWERRFEGDQQIVGSKITLDGEPYEVIGVFGPDFYFPPPYQEMGGEMVNSRAHVYVTHHVPPEAANPFFYRGLVRLKPGVDKAQAESELAAAAQFFATEVFPDPALKGLTVRLDPLAEGAVAPVRGPLLGLQAAALLVLLIACVNVANLMLSRAVERERDWALRTALGAGPFRLLAPLWGESLVFALGGAAFGLILARLLQNLTFALTSSYIPHIGQVAVGWREVVFALLLAALAGLISSLLPAFRLLRLPVLECIKEGSRSRRLGRPAGLLRQGMIAGQVALALVVLVAAGLLVRSIREVQATDLGFTNRDILVASINLPDARYSTPQQQRAALKELEEVAQSLPGVEEASVVSIAPFSGVDFGGAFAITERPEADPQPVASFLHVTPSYFETLGIPLLKGRLFTQADREDSQPVAVIDSHVADLYWPGESPLGKHVTYHTDEIAFEIVGVVKHVRQTALRPNHPREGVIYFPIAQEPQPIANLVVHSPSQQEVLASLLRSRISDFDPEMPVRIESLPSMIRQAHAGFSSPARLIEGLALMAALLASVGIYSLIAVMVKARTREIGIRMTLGSDRRQILLLLARKSLLQVGGGMAVGLLLSWLLGRYYQQVWSQVLYQVSPHDPVTYVVVSLLFLAVAVLASWGPSRRAVSIDPVQALREE